ncbi:MAG: DotU family type IV/VI secretion system protein [Pseudomonadota bacterium]
MSTPAKWHGLDTLELFKEFYARVYQVKKMIMAGAIEWEQISPEEIAGELSDREKTELLAAHLKAVLNEQMEYVSANTNALEFAAYREAAYLMSALADEVFLLQIQWFGAQYWNECSIEQGVFSTSYAGNDYYRRLDALRRKDVLTNLEKKQAMIFILSLQLGFRGKLRGEEEQVSEIRSQLLSMTGYSGKLNYLFPSAYAFVRNPDLPQKLEPFAGWNKFLLLTVALYLLASSLVWWWLSSRFTGELSGL